MKKKIFLLLIIGVFCSCDFLDVVPDNVATIEYAFRNRASAEKFLYTCYSYLPSHGDLGYDVAMSGGDDVWVHPYITWSTRNIAEGYQNSSEPFMNFWNNRGGASKNLWVGIRDCNIFLDNIDKVEDIPEYEKVRWSSEVKFLKAYYHFYLFRMYGPIPIIDENLPISADVEEVKVFREPVDEVVSFITDLMYEAAQDLPLENEVIEGTEAGRINNLIAMSMRAKVFVFAASPLFNGNNTYDGIVDSRGMNLFPLEFDENKWEVAAEACKEAIDMCHEQQKSLYDIVDPRVLNAPEVIKLQTIYRQAICDRWNKELIWGGTNYDNVYLSRMAHPRIMRIQAEYLSNILCEWAPTMKMIDLYYSENGVPINEDLNWINEKWYDKRYEVRPEPSSNDEKYFIKEGERTVYLHYNREPRFYASIGFDRGIYYGSGYYEFPGNVKHLEYFANEYTGLYSSLQRYSITGYNVKKMHSFLNSLTPTSYSIEYFPFPIMRLAELYLLYSEALNEAYGPTEEVYYYLDAVRSRAGLKGVKESWSNYSVEPQKPETKEGLREIIQTERNIELAFEGKRFWDIRRWRQITVLNEQPVGWNAFGDNETDFYNLTVVAQKPVEFTTKDYLWPIKEFDLAVNKNLTQNFGW